MAPTFSPTDKCQRMIARFRCEPGCGGIGMEEHDPARKCSEMDDWICPECFEARELEQICGNKESRWGVCSECKEFRNLVKVEQKEVECLFSVPSLTAESPTGAGH